MSIGCGDLPVREISSQADLDAFLKGETCEKFIGFVESLGNASVGKVCMDLTILSTQMYSNISWATNLISQMIKLIDEHPTKVTESRFGNPSFRNWLDSVRGMVPEAHYRRMLKLNYHDGDSSSMAEASKDEDKSVDALFIKKYGKTRFSVANEISSYLINSLGNYQRIDYGTGHEAHFVAWLYCCHELDLFGKYLNMKASLIINLGDDCVYEDVKIDAVACISSESSSVSKETGLVTGDDEATLIDLGDKKELNHGFVNGKLDNLGQVASDHMPVLDPQMPPSLPSDYSLKKKLKPLDTINEKQAKLKSSNIIIKKNSTIKGHCRKNVMVLFIFPLYMKLMRRLQETYWLEPAGSHGVWGLDDYHFLPFLWGAAQLIDHPYIKPSSVRDELPDDIVVSISKDDREKFKYESRIRISNYASDYLYFDAINSINRAKGSCNLSLRWHSPMLDDISAVKKWSKIYSGLLKMYVVEVLGKLPIMQHFLFGSILKFHGNGDSVMPNDRHVVHVDVRGGDCCGNPLPSIHAAGSASSGKCGHRDLARIPFD